MVLFLSSLVIYGGDLKAEMWCKLHHTDQGMFPFWQLLFAFVHAKWLVIVAFHRPISNLCSCCQGEVHPFNSSIGHKLSRVIPTSLMFPYYSGLTWGNSLGQARSKMTICICTIFIQCTYSSTQLRHLYFFLSLYRLLILIISLECHDCVLRQGSAHVRMIWCNQCSEIWSN